MKQIVCSIEVVLLLLGITGCGKKIEKVNTNSSNDDAKNDLISKCDIVVPEVYHLYQSNHSNPIVEGICLRENSVEYTVFLKAYEKVIYKYTYSFKENKVRTPDNDNYNTEKYEEYEEKCKDYDADGSTKGTCANHLYILSDYEKMLAMTETIPQTYMKIDITKLNRV